MKSRFWNSRIPGPFFVSFVLCFALIDYIMYAETKDSPLGWFWKFLALLHYIFSTLPYSEYISAMGLFLLGSLVLLGLVVWLSKDSATKAMQAATQKAPVVFDQSAPQRADTTTVASATPRGQVLTVDFGNQRAAFGAVTVGSTANGAEIPAKNSESKASPEIHQMSLWSRATAALDSMPSRSQWKLPELGVTSNLVVVFTGIAALFGLGTAAIVYYLSFGVFETQISKRADVIAMNLSEAVANQMLAKNAAGLRQELSKYAAREDVAYIFVEDDKGNVLEGSSENLPTPDAGSILQPSSKFIRWTPIVYKGHPVYETRSGILDGKFGILHLGIWKRAVENEIHRVLWPIALAILLIVLMGVMTFSLAVRGISKMLLQLAQSANRISEGQLETSSWINRRDEIGKLAISLERIRASLMAATKRLDPTQSSRPKPASERPQFSSQRL
jgi:HAMP domain-containing protein